MHPSASVVLFTVASGAGYGMLAALGLLAAAGALESGPWPNLLAFGIALLLVTIGLMASTFHLGRPRRAWRALSQWRSSWLSREGIAAIVAYLPSVALATLLAWGDPSWPARIGLGLATTLSAGATLYCTGMLYRTLPPIRAWANGFTVPGYLVMGLASGLPLVAATLLGQGNTVAVLGVAGAIAAVAALLHKRAYWRWLDGGRAITTPGTATGLGHLGRVRMLEPPHTGPNFLMKEMGYRIARRHAARLRGIALGLLAAAAAFGLGSALLDMLAVPAGLLGLLGVAVERWLFFAEARHTTMLYYGAEAA